MDSSFGSQTTCTLFKVSTWKSNTLFDGQNLKKNLKYGGFFPDFWRIFSDFWRIFFLIFEGFFPIFGGFFRFLEECAKYFNRFYHLNKTEFFTKTEIKFSFNQSNARFWVFELSFWNTQLYWYGKTGRPLEVSSRIEMKIDCWIFHFIKKAVELTLVTGVFLNYCPIKFAISGNWDLL